LVIWAGYDPMILQRVEYFDMGGPHYWICLRRDESLNSRFVISSLYDRTQQGAKFLCKRRPRS
jgi:hypothetical protein